MKGFKRFCRGKDKVIKRSISILLALLVSPLATTHEEPEMDTTLFERHIHTEGSDSLPYLLSRSDKAKGEDSSPSLVVFLHGAGERATTTVSSCATASGSSSTTQ